MGDEFKSADLLGIMWETLSAQLEPDTLNQVKQYANLFAQFQMERVSGALRRQNYTSAARAVDAQANVLRGLIG